MVGRTVVANKACSSMSYMLAECKCCPGVPRRHVVTDQERIPKPVQIRSVNDPELPYLTVEEMGMVRGVRVEDGQLVVTITPTYSGCPADVIAEDITNAVQALEADARVEVVLSPAWTTDWLLPSAHEKMKANGIAPPRARAQTGHS